MIHSVWAWVGFIVLVLILLALDLGVFNRGAKHISVRKALYLTGFWILIALTFNAVIFIIDGPEAGMEFLAGYVVEKSMSVDNLFVFLLVFSCFGIPDEYQHEALFYGILGAIAFRAVFVFAGAELLDRFDWMMYIFGAILIYAAIKSVMKKKETEDAGDSFVIRNVKKLMKSSDELDGGKLFTIQNGKRLATPLLLCIVALEFTDILFAIDSVPAVLAITTDKFIVYTSNIFAILGLRSLYFALRGVINRFEYFKFGVAAILAFVGAKMLLESFVEISVVMSLAVILSILAITVAVSLIIDRKRMASSQPQ